jgi:allophanate hydrolase subunit 2
VLYIAVEGGFDIPLVLGSISTCVRGGFGGWQGRQLVTGDRLPLCRTLASAREELRLDGLDLAPPPHFRALPGPQSDLFSEQELAAFFASQYTISAQSDRMGMRLKGHPLVHNRGHGFRIRRSGAWINSDSGERTADRLASTSERN